MAKDWYYSEQISQLNTATTMSTSGCSTGDVALTATHDLDAGNWLVIWSFDLGMSVDVVEQTARAACCVDGVQKQIYRVASQDTSTKHNCMAFAYMTGVSAGNHTFEVRYGIGSGTGTTHRAIIRQIHQLVVRMDRPASAENHYTETLGNNDVSYGGTYSDDVSVTFTPTRADDTWVLLANLNAGGIDTDLDSGFVKAVLDGTDITNREAHLYCHSVSPGEKYPYWAVAVRTLTAASHTFKMQVRSESVLGAFILANRRVMAFNLSRWPVSPTQESDGEETFASSSFQAKTNPLDYTPAVDTNHAWICGWLTNFTSPLLGGESESHVGTATDLETQLKNDRAAAGSTTEYFTQGLLYQLDAAGITVGTSPGAMEDRVRYTGIAMDIKTKGYSGFVLRRLPGTVLKDPMRSGGMVVPFAR